MDQVVEVIPESVATLPQLANDVAGASKTDYECKSMDESGVDQEGDPFR
mgnify:CR=1 FL=1